MDVVLTTIRNMGGNLALDSIPLKGTTLSLSIPVSVAIIQALIARCGGIDLAIPVTSVKSTAEVSTDSIFFSDSGPMLFHSGKEIEVRSLRRIFRQPEIDYDSGTFVQVIMTDLGGKQVGLLVDRVIGQHEIFIRPLLEPLSSIRGISGATVGGDGGIIFVTDTAACAAA